MARPMALPGLTVRMPMALTAVCCSKQDTHRHQELPQDRTERDMVSPCVLMSYKI